MQRYFISNQSKDGSIIHMNKDDYFHMHKVMRMRSGDKIICVDESEHVYLCKLIDTNEPDVEIIEELDEHHELPVTVRLVYGLPKLDKFEYVLQKCTELGVSEVVPFLSKRSLIRTDEARFTKKMERYQKIVKEASEQSEREKLVYIHQPMHLKDVLCLKTDLGLIAYEEASRQGESMQFEKSLQTLQLGSVVTIVVGPEGGFEKDEVEAFEKAGYKACSLGKRILRSETAPLYMMSVIGYYCELKGEL